MFALLFVSCKGYWLPICALNHHHQQVRVSSVPFYAWKEEQQGFDSLIPKSSMVT